jgi:hypothetical protein
LRKKLVRRRAAGLREPNQRGHQNDVAAEVTRLKLKS